VLVFNNYLHNHARSGAGYGVIVGGAAYATVIGNTFENNQHSVTSSGKAHSGYLASRNYILEYALDEKDHNFDVHGTEGGTGHVGGYAGTFFDIAFNTVRGAQKYWTWHGRETRAAFALRGKASVGAVFHHNVLVHDDYEEAMHFGTGGDPDLDEDDAGTFNLSYGRNKHGVDYSLEIAAGDFDGDGRTDVFLANGTGWFFSPGGSQPWEYLGASGARTKNLAFADIDNDGMTDVISRASGGQLSYVSYGTAAAVHLPSTEAQIQDLRFGDFDGDGLTDIFATLDRQWYVWYGSTQTSTNVGSSVTKLSEMLFGEFDGVPGTDVAAVRNNQWSYSSGAVDPWARLNSMRVKSFANAVAADFNGNGRTDIAFSFNQDQHRKWWYSVDGRGPLVALRDGKPTPSYPALRRLLVGHFDGRAVAQVLSWRMVGSGNTYRTGLVFMLWRNFGASEDFRVRSRQNMR
jgi:hypothetical protein